MAYSSLSHRYSICDATMSKPKRNWLYDVFPSFSGEDIRKTFLSHFLKELERKLIIAFEDNNSERGQSLNPVLKKAIMDSRIAVVFFSKNYASSTWCLDELLEIVECREKWGQTVIPVFYDLDPSDVRKQTGDFGVVFKKTCENKTEKVINQWKEALTDVANTLGFHSVTWDREAKLIEEIADDILDKLLLTKSEDAKDFVGIEDHIAKMSILLQLKSEEVKMVGIWGSSGIGKTTIARILFKGLSRHFQGSAFIDNLIISKILRGGNPDDYNTKLHLQEILLSIILDKEGIVVDHLGAVRDKLKHRKVLIIIDDLENQMVLDAMVGQTDWFGFGSRIIVITKDKHLLRGHGIDCIYDVGLPSNIQALQMFCRYAFGSDSPPHDYLDIASEVALLAGNLPLGLQVLGSCLRKRELDEWKDMLPRLRNELDGKIGKTLKVSYDELNNENDQKLFRGIACIFNGEKVNDVKLLQEETDFGLKNLIEKSLVHVRNNTIEMHLLLQEMGKNIVRTQSKEPGEREYLMDPEDVRYVLENNTGTENILGISLDMDETDKMHIHENAFERMRRLLFLKFNAKQNKDVTWHIPDGFNYLPSSLKLLRWDKYPLRCMPPKCCPQNLVKLQLQESKLEKLWEGIQSLQGLKDLDLQRSKHLTIIPDLSMATNLKTLDLGDCSSLMELPSSIQYLNKLEKLVMSGCSNLETLPPAINLQSLNRLDLKGCSRLRSFPDISTNFFELILDGTAIDEFPSNLCLENLHLLSMREMKSEKLWEGVQPLTVLMDMVCPSLGVLFLSDIPSLVELPSSFQSLHKLIYLEISNCINLETLPTDLYFESLGGLDLSGCSRLRSFPNISTNLSFLYLNRTGIKEVPWWIENFSRLRCLRMKECNRLQSVSLHISKLKYLDDADFSDCGALIEASLSGTPMESELPFPHEEASSSLLYDYIKSFKTVNVDFFNCFKLDQEAMIQNQLVFCKSMMLSGDQVPSYFTERTTGNSELDIFLLHSGLSKPILKFKACVVVNCISVPNTHDTFSIQVKYRFIGRLGNHFDVASMPLYIKNLKLGTQLIIFEFSILLKEEMARVGDPNYNHTQKIGSACILSSQVYPENKLPGLDLDLEVPSRPEVQFSLKEWGLEGPIQDKVPTFSFGSNTRPLKQNGPQFQNSPFVEMIQNNHGNSFGKGNFSPKQQFNNFQQGYQVQANAPISLQESKTGILLKRIMESLKQNAAQRQQSWQKQFVEMLQNNAQVQGDISPKQQFNNFQQGYQEEASTSTSLQERKNDLSLKQLMESQQSWQKQFVEMLQNNAHVQGNVSPKQQFNNFQQGYQEEASASTSLQESKNGLSMKKLMESQKQNTSRGQEFQQNLFVEMFQNNSKIQGNVSPRQQFNNFQHQSYQAPIQTQANVPTTPQESNTGQLLQQLIGSQKLIIEGQKQNTKETKDLNVKVDDMYNDFNRKLESLVAHVRNLEVQVAQTAETMKKQAEIKAKALCSASPFQEQIDYVPISKKKLKGKDVMIQSEPDVKRAQTSKLKIKTLSKLENLGRFVVPFSINEVKFNEFLCDTEAKINIMSKKIADEKGFMYFQPSKLSKEYADSSSTTLEGFLPNVLLQVENCFFTTDFHIVKMRKDEDKPLILGYEFLAIVGALVDFPNKRISFTKINKNVFYPAVHI